jgi:hypothetical protein
LVEVFVGRDLRKSVGDFINKMVRIDRVNNLYIKHLSTDGGAVLMDVNEPLDTHNGSWIRQARTQNRAGWGAAEVEGEMTRWFACEVVHTATRGSQQPVNPTDHISSRQFRW